MFSAPCDVYANRQFHPTITTVMAGLYRIKEVDIRIRVCKLLALRNASNSVLRCTLATVETDNPSIIKLLPTANRHPQAMRVTLR